MDVNIDDLIQANNGEDIEIEFYYNGKKLLLNTSIYEIVNSPDEKVKKEEGFMGSVKDLFSKLSGEGGLILPGARTIYYTIRDKPKTTNTRRDSLAEYTEKIRGRTKS